MTDAIDLAALCRGDKGTWDGFVRRYARLIVSAVRGVVRDGGEVEDLVQDVFLRLCKDGFRLMRTYDPERAGLSTWLTIVARSTARDSMRRRQLAATPIEAVPEAALAVEPKMRERVKFPDRLLSPRQKLVLTMLYDHDLEVSDVATFLRIDPQTVRSTHHKAMLKLRTYFAEEDSRDGDAKGVRPVNNKNVETGHGR